MVNARCTGLELHLALIACTVPSEGVSASLSGIGFRNKERETPEVFNLLLLFETGALYYAALAVLEQVCSLVLFDCFIYKDRTWEQGDSSMSYHDFIYQITVL